MIFRYTAPAHITRRVTEAVGFYVVLDGDEAQFPAQLVTPNADEAVRDSESPRDFAPWRIRWRGGFQAPQGGVPQPGERLLLKDVEYEITTAPRRVDEGRTLLEVWEVKCQPVADLYPIPGVLEEMDGVEVEPTVPFSAYRGDESHSSQGTYEDFDAEAPLDFQDELRKNRQLSYGDYIYKIVSVEIDPVGRYHRMRVRRAGG